MTIFSKIIFGDIPCYKIAEDDKFIAFLDIQPCIQGHTLVVPKIETDKLFDLPKEYLRDLLPFAQPIAKAMQAALHCNRVNIITVGFEVPHAHIHLLPMNSMRDANILSKKNACTNEEMKAIQESIVSFL